MRPSVTIVDYGLCNIDSVARALDECGAAVVVTRSTGDIQVAERIVLPGVGSFARAMKNLEDWRLAPALRERVASGRIPFLGICLGMQLMASHGSEHGSSQGLGLLEAEVVRLAPINGERIPHIGWNEIVPLSSPLLVGLDGRRDFYFVHSFHLVPAESGWIAATTPYAGLFVSSLAAPSAPIFGTQFHPEKSQKNGFKVLRNFLAV